jgi:hypothetical protein
MGIARIDRMAGANIRGVLPLFIRWAMVRVEDIVLLDSVSTLCIF